MAWPLTTISTANLDSTSDNISAARADLYQTVVAVNDMIVAGLGNVNVNVDVSSFVTTNTDQTITGEKTFTTNANISGNLIADHILQPEHYKGLMSASVNGSYVLYPNFANGSVQSYEVDQNFTLGEPSAMPYGGTMTLLLQQQAGGPYTMSRIGQTWFSGNGYTTLSNIQSQLDVVHIYNSGSFGYLCTVVNGYTPP